MGITAPCCACGGTLPATADSIKQLRSLAVAFALENCEPDDQLLGDLALAVSEAATNAVQHAYHNHPEPGPIELDAYQTNSHLILRIADHGATSEQPLQPGIGLRILSQIATAQISNHPNGTTVTMSLPCPKPNVPDD
jgi:anti-sigma regulatory factor (Ser/Thr protein kinase)